MIPLHPVALGLVVVALVVDGGGWDLLPDPLGWGLVLVGTLALPREIHRRDAMVVAAAAALLVAAVVWPPGVAERVADTDESLSWALSLPQPGSPPRRPWCWRPRCSRSWCSAREPRGSQAPPA